MRQKSAAPNGFALIATVVVLFFLLLLTFFLYVLLLPSIKTGHIFFDNTIALYHAEAGVARLLSTIRNTNPPLPETLGKNVTLALAVDEGFSYSNTVVITNNGNHRYSANVFGTGGLEARRMLTVVFSSFNAPNATDGAVCVYGDVPPAIIIGTSFVNGADHILPRNFACQDSGCFPTELSAGDSVANTYNSSNGGVNFRSNFLELINYIPENNIKTVALTVGTREAPLITIVPSQQTLTLSVDGAGLLVVSNAATLSFARGTHYEGLIVVMDSGKIIGDVSNYIYGTLVFVNSSTSSITFNGTKPNVVYSAAAIDNLQKVNAYLTRIISLKMFSTA